MLVRGWRGGFVRRIEVLKMKKSRGWEVIVKIQKKVGGRGPVRRGEG